MVLRRKASTHQLFGTAGRVIRDPDIYKRQSLRSCQTADGQHSSSSLHKQDGRNSLAGSFKSSCTTMGMVPRKQLGDIRSTSTRTFKCQSRPGIQNVTGFQRLETRPLDVSITLGEMGALGDRSLCIPADTPAPKVCQLETRSLTSAFRCIFNELERHSGVCLSPLCSDRALSAAGKDTECRTASSGGPTITTPVHRSSSVIPNITQTSDERQSVSPSGQPTTGWMERNTLLSANVMTQQIFRKQLETFCWQPGERTLPALTPPRGVNGLAGVIDGKSIPFQLL